MKDWASLRATDNVFVGGNDSNILLGSNVNTFIVADATVYVRVVYI